MITVVRGSNDGDAGASSSGHSDISYRSRPVLTTKTGGKTKFNVHKAMKSLAASGKPGKMTAAGAKVVRPEQVIPMDADDEFKDF